MTGPVRFRTGSRPVRRDKLIKERVHDTYQARRKFREPTACPNCGAVFAKGRWQWAARPAGAQLRLCPACQRIRDEFPAGYVTIRGDFLTQHRDQILGLIRRQGETASADHPLERIISIGDEAAALVVTTTGIHVARAIGEALKSAYQGELEFHYNEGENLLRVNWRR